jgi:hypothetical protein
VLLEVDPEPTPTPEIFQTKIAEIGVVVSSYPQLEPLALVCHLMILGERPYG